MDINILMPGSAQIPIGGFKIIFEYANGLSKKGHKVKILIPLIIENQSENFLKNLKLKITFLKEMILKNYLPDSWFKFNKNVNIQWIFSLDEENIPDGDLLIATSWQTAKKSNDFSLYKGKKIYFIQSLETWHGKYEDVIETWKMPFKKIVISKWLLDFAQSINEEAVLIYNGLDFNLFGMDILPENRNPRSIIMLYHTMENKGSIYGLKAMINLKNEFPDLIVTMFGVNKKPERIPNWIKYITNPEQTLLKEIYNTSAIFVNPSLIEGFGLTPVEAMQCGCSVVVSDINGHNEFSFNEITALLFPPKDVESIVNNVRRLISNDELRIKLAYEGNKYVKKFNWERSIDEFERVILEK